MKGEDNILYVYVRINVVYNDAIFTAIYSGHHGVDFNIQRLHLSQNVQHQPR